MMTGGVARNRGVVQALEEKLGAKLFISENPDVRRARRGALRPARRLILLRRAEERYNRGIFPPDGGIKVGVSMGQSFYSGGLCAAPFRCMKRRELSA